MEVEADHPPDSPVLHKTLAKLRAGRLERTKKMLARLAEFGFPLDLERVLDIAGHGSIGRPHVAQALADAGYVGSREEAFDRLIGRKCKAYVPRSPYRPEDAVAAGRPRHPVLVEGHRHRQDLLGEHPVRELPVHAPGHQDRRPGLNIPCQMIYSLETWAAG
jgi:predicted metal-dependent phosphoesterase TrpH